MFLTQFLVPHYFLSLWLQEGFPFGLLLQCGSCDARLHSPQDTESTVHITVTKVRI